MRPERADVVVLALACALASCRDKVREPAANEVKQPAPAAKPLLLSLPKGQPHAWVETNRYRLRVLDARPCGEGPSDRYRLAVSVEIEAKPGSDVSEVFASPRGAELEKNGNIFRPLQEPAPGCEPLLQPTPLAPGEAARGILAFEAPDISYLRSGVLRFKPPRWGFESKVSVQLPDCFGADCPPSNPPARRAREGADGPAQKG